MWKSVKAGVLMAASSGFLLAACGGGSDGPRPYGAIALNVAGPSALIATNFISQDKANAAAVTRCGGEGCVVVYEFSGSGTCAALATGGGGSLVFGVAGGATQADAEAGAVAACTAKGGASCSIPASIPGKCNLM
jgi:threonine dehydrogenase-like Zn-dependent dehydrogenase